MKTQATNLILMVAVLVVVGGVAWYRLRPDNSPKPADSPATTVPEPVAAPETEPAPSPRAEVDDITTAAPPAEPPASAPAETQKLPRVVDLGADKCIPCKKLAPILEELKKEYDGRVVVEFIDVWKDPKAGEPYNIRVIPTQVFFDAEGKEVWRHEGFLPKEAFEAKFKELGVK